MTVAAPPAPVLLGQAQASYRAGELEAAETGVVQLLRDDPGHPEALALLGLLRERQGDREQAERLLERACRLAPTTQMLVNLGVVRMGRGDLDGAIAATREAIRADPQQPEARANLLFALDLHPLVEARQLRREREAFDRACCWPLTEQADAYPNDRDPDQRLRVGYLGGDFRTRHSASGSCFFLTAHDPAQVEVALYVTQAAGDPTAAPFRERADLWADVSELSDAEVAHVIREDRIDILVDLSGPTAGGRPLVVARKPAPLVVSGWGYPTGLGIGAVDYLVGDPVSHPVAHHGRYPEQILRLPALMGYRAGEDVPELAMTPPEARLGYRTYGYLGRAQKLNGPTLALWAEILAADPTGRLLLKSGQYGDQRQYQTVVNALSALGVELSRIDVQGSTSRREHLAAHNAVDLLLDPFPQGGGVTVMDGLLMGVVTVTQPGETAVGRIGASALTAVGQAAWIAADRAHYVRLAAARPGLIGALRLPDRRAVRSALLGSILCDHAAYARAVEAAYRAIWRRWTRANP